MVRIGVHPPHWWNGRAPYHAQTRVVLKSSTEMLLMPIHWLPTPEVDIVSGTAACENFSTRTLLFLVVVSFGSPSLALYVGSMRKKHVHSRSYGVQPPVLSPGTWISIIAHFSLLQIPGEFLYRKVEFRLSARLMRKL